jgi:hypothetical protein
VLNGEHLAAALLFLARATVMVAFTVLYIYAPEVFPTSIRGSGVGTANAMARVGGMLAPFLSIELVEDGRCDLIPTPCWLCRSAAGVVLCNMPSS